MKTIKIISILIVIVGVIYYQLDKRLFYFGKNDLHIYNLLPLKIKPEYRPSFEGGFALRDDYGFTIAAKGNTYPVDNKTILIDRVLKYGFNDSNLIAIVTDAKRNKYYVKFDQDQKDKTVIKANMTTADKFHNVNFGNWVDIDGNDDYILNLALWRNCLMFIIIGLLLVFIYILVRYRRAKISRS